MILAFEMNWAAMVHAPGNAATVRAMMQGCPGRTLRLHAEPAHIAELRRDPALADAAVEYVGIDRFALFQGRPAIVSWGRFWHEFALIRGALRAVPRGAPCLVMLLSTTATGVFAAALAAWLHGRCWVQVGLHGDLNEVAVRRSRHPLRRAFDVVAGLNRRWRKLRFLVLDGVIRDELARIAPAALERTDVMPLPVNIGEVPAGPGPVLRTPVRIAFVGQATMSKGIDIYLAMARRMRARHGERVQFDVIGRADPNAPAPGSDDLVVPISPDYLSRAEFVRRLDRADYVFLPLFGTYYRLAASGALLDALTWLKPVIIGRIPLSERWFAEFGDIGDLCDDAAAMEAAVERVIVAPDPARHAAQVTALRAARDTRTPEAVGRTYASIAARFFPASAGSDRPTPVAPRWRRRRPHRGRRRDRG